MENEEECLLIGIFSDDSLESTPQRSLSSHEDDALLLISSIDFGYSAFS